MSKRLVVGPFNRVEGDLEVKLDIADGQVRDAWVSASLYRGFEQILRGRTPEEALVIAPRICGICSVSQSLAASAALAQAMGLTPAPNGLLAQNLVHGAENLADHLTHFHLFFMPDFAHESYANRPWFEAVQRGYQATRGEASARALAARSRLLHVLGILAGKWPHSLALRPGGTTCAIDMGDKMRLISIIGETRRFIERYIYRDTIENMLALTNEDALQNWIQSGPPQGAALPLFLHLANDLELQSLGPSGPTFMSYGAYDGAFAGGLWRDGVRSPVPLDSILEDNSHAWLRGDPAPPAQSTTQPDMSNPAAYSWCRAPRLDGAPVEVGALARQLIDGQPLITDVVARSGGNVRNRVLARLLECARIVRLMEGWAKELTPRDPFCTEDIPLQDAEGVGLVEAARGSLGHWLRVRNGRIDGYQIIAPTTWNFSPRDTRSLRGPLEQALIGTPVRDGETAPLAVQHVVRSFDPCMVCTVH
ncbi:nickel-dependent hydrogenase large subunit [Magnetospira thiophila]